jgi:ABC-type glycerol-3-phosphate transport system substrate-binding protein
MKKIMIAILALAALAIGLTACSTQAPVEDQVTTSVVEETYEVPVPESMVETETEATL